MNEEAYFYLSLPQQTVRLSLKPLTLFSFQFYQCVSVLPFFTIIDLNFVNQLQNFYFVETKIYRISHFFVIFTQSFLVLELVLEPTAGYGVEFPEWISYEN
jgi:hypothetical protein